MCIRDRQTINDYLNINDGQTWNITEYPLPEIRFAEYNGANASYQTTGTPTGSLTDTETSNDIYYSQTEIAADSTTAWVEYGRLELNTSQTACTKINITWEGLATRSGGQTPTYTYGIYNFTDGSWDDIQTIDDATETVVSSVFTDGCADYLNDTGWVWVGVTATGGTSGRTFTLDTDWMYVNVSYEEYNVEVEHNTTISAGKPNSINISINFTTSAYNDNFAMYIYDFYNAQWDSSPCWSGSIAAGTYEMHWCNVTSNAEYYNSTSGRVMIRLNSTIDSDRSTLKEDYVQFYVGYLSYVEVELIDPSTAGPNNIIQNYTFLVNATVVCKDGPCGYVNGTVMYNLSSAHPDTPINTSQGDRPFYIQEPPYPALAMKPCPTNPLDAGEFCNITWTVNATGDVNTDWEIGVLFNSSYSDIQNNHTDNATVSIIPCSIDFNLTWSSIDFGLLNPNTYNNSAPGNADDEYNITVNSGSCNLDLYIRGTDLELSLIHI